MGIAALTIWSNGQKLTSSALNANFAAIRDHYNDKAVEDIGAQTIEGVKTFSAIPVFSLGATITAGGLTVTAGGIAITAGGMTVTAGKLTTAASADVAGAGFNLPHGVVPGTPANGDVWSTTAGLYAHINGTTIGPLSQNAGSGTSGKVTRWSAANTLADAGASDNGTYTSNGNQPRARVTGAGETLQTSHTAVTWAAAALNVGTLWAGGAATRITIPANAGGSYHFTVSGSVNKSAGSDTTVNVKLRKNGTTDLGVVGSFGATSTSIPFSMSWDDDCSAADYYEVYMQAGTATVDLTTPQLCARKVW